MRTISETIIYSPPFSLDPMKYKVSQVKSNRGDKYGMPHFCSWEKDKDMNNQFIGVGEPNISLLEITRVENSDRKFFKTWRFHNEECLVQWLNEYGNPEWRT